MLVKAKRAERPMGRKNENLTNQRHGAFYSLLPIDLCVKICYDIYKYNIRGRELWVLRRKRQLQYANIF